MLLEKQTRDFWRIIHMNCSKHPLSTESTKHPPSTLSVSLSFIYWERHLLGMAQSQATTYVQLLSVSCNESQYRWLASQLCLLLTCSVRSSEPRPKNNGILFPHWEVIPRSPELWLFIDFLSLRFFPAFKFCFSWLLLLQHLNCCYHLAEPGGYWRDAVTEQQNIASRCFSGKQRQVLQTLHSWTALPNNCNVLRLTMSNTQTHTVITQTSFAKQNKLKAPFKKIIFSPTLAPAQRRLTRCISAGTSGIIGKQPKQVLWYQTSWKRERKVDVYFSKKLKT